MGVGSENIVLCNFTTGNYMAIDQNGVAETLMARDYKDPQCVVVKCNHSEKEKGEQHGNGYQKIDSSGV